MSANKRPSSPGWRREHEKVCHPVNKSIKMGNKNADKWNEPCKFITWNCLKADMVEIALFFFLLQIWKLTVLERGVCVCVCSFFSPKNSLNSRKAENDQLSCQAPLQHIYWSSCWTHASFWFCSRWLVQCYSLLCTSFWNGYRDVWARSTVARHWMSISAVFSGMGPAPLRWRGVLI